MSENTERIGQRIKERREALNYSAEKVAEIVGIAPSTMYRYENGDIKKVRIDKLALIAATLATTPGYLMGWDNTNAVQPQSKIKVERFSNVPIVGSIKGGPGGIAYEDIEGYSEAADLKNADEYFYLRVTGDSMSPRIMSGDLALIHKQDYIESGELAAVIVDGDAEPEGTLKKVVKESGAVILESFNSTVYHPRVFVGEEINRLHIAGKVVRTEARW